MCAHRPWSLIQRPVPWRNNESGSVHPGSKETYNEVLLVPSGNGPKGWLGKPTGNARIQPDQTRVRRGRYDADRTIHASLQNNAQGVTPGRKLRISTADPTCSLATTHHRYHLGRRDPAADDANYLSPLSSADRDSCLSLITATNRA